MVTGDGSGDRNGTVKIHTKSLAFILTGLTVIWAVITFVFGLMYFPRDEGVKLQSDFEHHCEKDMHEGARVNFEKQEKVNKEVTDGLHRIELRQVEQASPRVKRSRPELYDPAVLERPMPEIPK